MKNKEKKVKRRSLITDLIIYSVIYITVLCIGGYTINKQMLLNKESAKLMKRNNILQEEKTQEMFNNRNTWNEKEKNLIELKKEKEVLEEKIKDIENTDKKNVKKIDELNSLIDVYNVEKENLLHNQENIKEQFNKVNQEYISINNKYQEYLKNK